jgi:Transglycosylase SLT domain
MTTNAVVRKIDGIWMAQRAWRWKTAVVALVLAVWVRPVAARPAQASVEEREAFLQAVAQVETGGNPRAVGRFGERGLYQFGRDTWRRYTSRSFYDAHSPAVAHEIAVRHFDWLYQRVVDEGRRPTPYIMAVAWNGGLGRALSGRMPKSTRDYAARVTNVSGFRVFDDRPAALLIADGDDVSEGAARVEPVKLHFAVDEIPIVAQSAPQVVPVAPSDVTFTLTPAAPEAPAASAKRPHFIFATIAE